MKQINLIALVILSLVLLTACETPKTPQKDTVEFVEIIVQNHLVSHGFDQNNVEILEQVTVEKPRKKLIRVDRIRSVSEQYILTSYGYGRLVYWEYEGSYDQMKKLLSSDR